MKLWPLAMIATACFSAAPVLSKPVNPTVASGTATFNPAGNAVTVTNSNGAIINWQQFSIGSGTVHFAQPSASSSVLNRVMADPSVIYGTLSSNGRVFMVNPAGIVVGPGGNRVATAAFVAPRPIPSFAPSAALAPAATVQPTRGPLSVAVPANAGRMVDGSVTLRMPLVDASPILFR